MLSSLLSLSMTLGLLTCSRLQARDEPITRGLPSLGQLPNPSSLNHPHLANPELADYLSVLEQQNETLCHRLHTLEQTTEGLNDQIRDRDSRLVKLSQTLGEKEQLVATILANEEALSEALALRDERLTLLEESLGSLRSRAGRAVELENLHQELISTVDELHEQLHQVQQDMSTLQAAKEHRDQELAQHQQAYQELYVAYQQLQTQRDLLDQALEETHHSLAALNHELVELREAQSRQQLAARQAASDDAAALQAAQSRLVELETAQRELSQQLASAHHMHNQSQTQAAVSESACAQLSAAYQTVLTARAAADEEIDQLHERLGRLGSQLASARQERDALTLAHEQLSHVVREREESLETASLALALSQDECEAMRKQLQLQQQDAQLLAERYDQLESAYQATQERSHDTEHQLALALQSLQQEQQEAYRLSQREQTLVTTNEFLSERCHQQEHQLCALQQELQQLQLTAVDEHSQREVVDKAHQELMESYAELATCHRQLETRLNTLVNERLELKEQLAQLSHQQLLEREQAQLQEASYGDLAGSFRELTARFTQTDSELQGLKHARAELTAQLARLQEDNALLQRDLQRGGAEQATLSQQHASLIARCQGLDTQLQDLVQLSRDKDQILVAARSEKAELHRQLDELSTSWQQLDCERQQLAARVTELETFPTRLKNTEERLREQGEHIQQLTARLADSQTAMVSLERTRDSLAKELADLKAFQGALLQWEVEKLASARCSPAQPATASSTGHVGSSVRRIHIVSPGETLSNIAQQYNKSIQDLYNANSDSIPNHNQVRIGTALVIP